MNGDINLKRIIVFLLITISNIFRFDIFELKSELERLPTWIFYPPNSRHVRLVFAKLGA